MESLTEEDAGGGCCSTVECEVTELFLLITPADDPENSCRTNRTLAQTFN